MSTKCGNYSGDGKNPLSNSSLDENGDKDDKEPAYPDYAGGMKPLGSKDVTSKYVEK